MLPLPYGVGPGDQMPIRCRKGTTCNRNFKTQGAVQKCVDDTHVSPIPSSVCNKSCIFLNFLQGRLDVIMGSFGHFPLWPDRVLLHTKEVHNKMPGNSTKQATPCKTSVLAQKIYIRVRMARLRRSVTGNSKSFTPSAVLERAFPVCLPCEQNTKHCAFQDRHDCTFESSQDRQPC